jgi:7-carboxy-7-deazaguanine synthase
MDKLSISEIFGPTIQGEGEHIGKQCIFVRSGGCDYNCSWCDTKYAVDKSYKDKWESLDFMQIFERVSTLSPDPMWVVLSGGNPALQDFSKLIDLGQRYGYKFSAETQGSVFAHWFYQLDHLTISPKPPSANIDFSLEKLDKCMLVANEGIDINLKFVINDEVDYLWAKDIASHYPDTKIYLQPCLPNDIETNKNEFQINKLKWLSEMVIKDKWLEATILPQLHILMWQGKKGF